MGMVESAKGTSHGDGGDDGFAAHAERHRRELQVHCYRMLGSFEDAEDMVQETLTRAWRKRDTFQGRSSFRTWLYRIATNACLDFLARHEHRVIVPGGETAPRARQPAPEIPWLQPYPDRLLEPAAPDDAEPDAIVVAKETVELAFLVAVQLLPPRQRAVLILRDVLDFSAKETADLMDATIPSVNGALRRARATLRERRPSYVQHGAPRADLDERERLLLQQYVDASERGDPEAMVALLREDVSFSMPPEVGTYVGRDTVVGAWVEGGFGADWFGTFRCVVTQANRMPAVAFYHARPGDSVYRPFAVDVLTIEDGLIAEVTAFPLVPLLEAFGLPRTL